MPYGGRLVAIAVVVGAAVAVVSGTAVLHVRSSSAEPRATTGAMYRTISTLHWGPKRYRKHWNFWVRIDGKVNRNTARIWGGFERPSPALDRLISDMRAPRTKVETERELWRRIGIVWTWWKRSVRVDNASFATIRSASDGWPTADDYGRYYVRNKRLVCAACFSKAHLFATILGRIVYPRERIALAYAHHTQAGAPKTASHVYVAVYVAGRWLYVDPTHAWSVPFPAFEQRRSLGPVKPTSIDYTRPFQITPLPGSDLSFVPYLGTD